MFRRWEAVATCTGERADRGPAPVREPTETVSRATHDQTENRNSAVLTGTRLRPGALEHAGAAGGWWC